VKGEEYNYISIPHRKLQRNSTCTADSAGWKPYRAYGQFQPYRLSFFYVKVF